MELRKIFGGISLVSCTTIGGGVLALPTSTVAAGFIPATLSLTITWLFMLISALLLLEVNLWFSGSNLISLAKHTLGTNGKYMAWIVYLLLLYTLLSLYLLGSSSWLQKLSSEILHLHINKSIAVVFLATCISITIAAGTHMADRVNRIFAIGLFVAFIGLIYLTIPKVNISHLQSRDFTQTFKALPIIITSFGYSIIIPSLTSYFDQQINKLVPIIVIGSIIPLIIYIIWEYIGIGILSQDLIQLSEQANSTEVAKALEQVIGNHFITLLANIFSICAILTSFIGVSLSLFDFLSDGLKLKKTGINKLYLVLIAFIPPIVIVQLYPTGFIKVLSFGGILVAILLGLLPILMTWNGRRKYHSGAKFTVFGGKPLLVICGIFFILVMVQL